jgi:hypothetical protein
VKKIIATYGATIIAISIMSVILICMVGVLLGKNGNENALAFLANESLQGTSAPQETEDAFLQYKERKMPEIIYIEDYEVTSKEYVPVRNCFTAKSHEGETLAVEVSYILNIHEEPEEIQYVNGDPCFYFELHGVYQVFVQATDQNNCTTYAMVKMPVNKGGFH